MYTKKQSLEIISKHSQHLAGKLARLDDNLDFAKLAHAFNISVTSGGLNELDFERVEGQSYNPRPARIALIILECSFPLSSDLLIAAFIAASDCKDTRFLAFSEALELANDALKMEPKQPSKSAILSLALHLDRARQFHRSAKSKDENQFVSFYQKTKMLSKCAESINMYFFKHLTHWLNRYERKKNTVPRKSCI